jgi:anti-sigma-K factor RskA
MSVDCVGEIVDRGVIEIVELVVKHEGKLRKLIKALKNCCSHVSSSGSEDDPMEEMNALCEDRVVWAPYYGGRKRRNTSRSWLSGWSLEANGKLMQ